MRHITNTNKIFIRLAAFLLAFFVLMSPVAPVFADELPPVEASEPAPASEPSPSEPINEIPEAAETEESPSSSPEPENPSEEITEPETDSETDANKDPLEEESQTQSLLQENGTNSGGNSSTIKQILPQSDQSTGALVFDYPITVPPGRKGLQPELNLRYNSQSNDPSNVFGNGWSIDIPYIERINRKGIEKLYTENYFQSSMDGELVSTGSGNYAAKVENGNFLTYSLSSNAWTVKDKSGTIYKFGHSAGTRQDNSSDTSKVYKWMLEEVRDRNDNYIKYEYYKDAGQIYPYKITYTGSGSTDGILQVEFLRESRTDSTVKTNTGFSVTTSYRINEIQTKVSGSWVKKYALAYTTGDNTVRSVLNTITESGIDESSVTVSLPTTDFDYQASTTSGGAYSRDSNWTGPNVDSRFGVMFVDFNGDGLTDVLQSYKNSAGTQVKNAYANTGSGWSTDTNYTPPILFYDEGTSPHDLGVRAGDLNGDGKVDLVRGFPNQGTAYTNNGSGWTQDNNWAPPVDFSNGNNDVDTGARLVDVNGDGLVDIFYTPNSSTTEVRVNNGSGWTLDSGWSSPVQLQNGTILGDFNSDGLVDILQGYTLGGTTTKVAYLHNGNKGWTSNSGLAPTIVFVSDGEDKGVREADLNGDGLSDLIQGTANGSLQRHFINKGTGWTEGTTWAPTTFIDGQGNDTGARLADLNGDGMVDVIDLNSSSSDFYPNSKIKADLFKTLTNSRGGTSTVTYKTTPEYKNGSTALNPNLPYLLDTVYQISHDNGQGIVSSTTFSYEGGKYYYNNAYDRRLAGFNKISRTDAAGNKVISYLHQGDSSDSSGGEYVDHVSKIGKVYKTEITDSSGNVYLRTVNKWDKYNIGTDHDFVKLVRKTSLSYDGDSDHKDKAESYTFDDTYGNLTEKIFWGEVTASVDGAFTDTGSDKFTTTYTYASNTTDYIVGLPSQETTVDQSSNKVRESKYYYDTLSQGSVNKGNLTKEDKWKSGTSYIDYEKTYNSYGLIATEKDPRDKATTYSYDTHNLYPASVTNSLSRITSYTYDYSLGKPKQVTDENSRVFQTVYDGLDRAVEEKQPDLTTPSSLVTKTTYAYTSQSLGNKIQRSNYLDGSTTVDTITYTDGFDRPIQVRTEMEDSNTYSVTDIVYNNIEQVHKESAPYASGGTSKTSATTNADLLITHSYDPMYRVTTTVNALGTVTNAYDDWKLSITDARSKAKHLYKDAYDNLIKVDEVNSGSTYTTNYEYNGNSNLTKITDALSNIRNFTYDGLGRRSTAQDLHASGDATFGTWTYVYDDSGNLTSVTDPKSQVIEYTYDDINRVLTENYTGNAGTEVSYTYDSGTDGIGRLTSVTATGANTAYVYNPHGKVKQETKTINSTAYQTDYTFDRQGNTLEITNPDSSKVKYTYNTAGQLETVQRKESTDASFINVVTDYDYGPQGEVTYQANANGTHTLNTYDAAKLYRLSRKQTSNGAPTSSTVTFYSGAGDGYVRSSLEYWDPTHDATDGLDSHYTSSSAHVSSGKVSGIDYLISRAFLPFDTSSLPSGANITAATLKVYVDSKANEDNDGDDWVTVVQTSQASTSSLATTDFDTAGSINNPEEGIDSSERKDISSVTTGQYLNFALNMTGRSWISDSGFTKLGLREGHDAIDSAFVSSNSAVYDRLIVRTSEYEGTSSDPVLEVTYTAPGGSTLFQDLSYTYDANNNVTRIVDASNTNSAKTVDYVYDDLNRLTSATATNVASGQSTYSKSYSYDAIGNITAGDAGTYAYAGTGYANPHAVTSISSPSTTFSYDNNGNLTGDGTWTNTWDYGNRLTQSAKTGTTVTYGYDHSGQRVKLANGTTTTYYPSKFYNTDGTTAIKHITTPDGQTIATVKGTGGSAAVSTVHTDHLTGSNVVTNSSATQEELLDYFPYGSARLDQKAGSFDEQRKYAGSEFDADTSLNYMGARYYHSAIGRFISQDIVFLAFGTLDSKGFARLLYDPQQLNSYSYAANNPLKYIDPTGMFNVETGKVERGDTWDSVAKTINQHYDVNYSIPTIQRLNSNPESLYEGQVLVPNSHVPDITNKLDTLMVRHANDLRINSPLWFRGQVKNGGPWDLKNTSDFDSDKYSDGFVYSGNRIRSDAPGNIHYGFVGSHAFWSTSKMLLKQAGKAQLAAGNSKPEWQKYYYGDDPTDQYFIKQGIGMYRNLWHGNGKLHK